MVQIKLSVIIPCYNEEKRFYDGFNHYYDYFKKQKYPWEIILIDDGSSDKTLTLMKKAAKGKNNIKIINYKMNRGKGYAIVQGVKKAKGKYILFTDIDHSVPVRTIDDFFKFFDKGTRVIIGSRRVAGSKFIIRQNPIREFLGRGFTFLVRVFIDWRILDATCGFKVFERNVAKKIFSKISIYDWAFDAEILFLCQKYHFNLVQAPVYWSDSRGTKVSLKKDILNSILGLLKIRLNDLAGRY